MTDILTGEDRTHDRTYFGGQRNKPMEWKPLPYMEEYLLELSRGEEPRAPDYLTSVRVGLGHFGLFTSAEGIRHPSEITRDLLLRFQAHLADLTNKRTGAPLSLSYRQQLMKYVRGWINWLVDVRYIDESPWYRIRVGRIQKHPKPLEVHEVEELFEAHRGQAFSIPPFAFHRREVILVLLFGWGLRIHELQGLNVGQMPMTADVVYVRNKGGGSKAEPYSDVMKAVVLRWLSQRAKSARHDEDALIIDQTGGRLSIARIRQIVTDCGARAGISINPHRLRDTFGTTMLDGDAEIERVMKMMGHTQRSQTLAYSEIRHRKLKETHDRVMNPVLEQLVYGAREDK